MVLRCLSEGKDVEREEGERKRRRSSYKKRRENEGGMIRREGI